MNFEFLFTMFGTVLAVLYQLRQSYAFMIIGLTLIVMVVVTPLTLKATRSMLMMQQLQPELKKLQSRYKDDRQQLNEEMLKFYKENNINPVGGCLPLLVQTPVFLVLYSVLRGLTLRVTTMGSNTGWVTGQQVTGQSLTKPPHVLHVFDPQYVPHDSLLYKNLSVSTSMQSLGMDLSRSATDIFSTSGLIAALPYIILIALVALTAFVQQRQIQARNTGTAAVNPQQQAIMKIMPFFLPIFSFTLAAGLVVYFVVSNTYRVGQQWFISRSIYGKHEAKAAAEGGGKADGGKSDGGDDIKPYKPSGSSGGVQGWLERLTGQGQTAPDEPDEPAATKKVDTGKKTPATKPAKSAAKPAARSGGGRTTPAKNTSKARATSAAGAERNGRDRSAGTASKQKASTRTSSASGSGSRTTSTKPSSSPAESSSTDRPATLQPRARKNKKR
jgi:YidC/Oxa1 family membrane protein insertase